MDAPFSLMIGLEIRPNDEDIDFVLPLFVGDLKGKTKTSSIPF